MRSFRFALLALFCATANTSQPSIPPSSLESVSTRSSRCSLRGRVDPQYKRVRFRIQPAIVSTAEDCAILCYRRMVNESLSQSNKENYCLGAYGAIPEYCLYCASYEYNIHTGYCQLWGLDITQHIIRDMNGPHLFGTPYDNCYEYPPTACEAPYGVNLLDNSGFDSPLLGPWISTVGTLGPGRNSLHSWTISRAADPSFYYNYHDYNFLHDYSTLTQSFNICPGALYLIRFDYKMAQADETIDFYCGSVLKNAEGDNNYKVTARNTTSWQSFSGFCRFNSYDISGGSYEYVFSLSKQRGAHRDFLIDNFEITRVREPLRFKPNTSSLLVNGDFESGMLQPWKAHKNSWQVYFPGISSAYAARVHDSFNPKSLSQVVHTKKGHPYLLQLDLSTGDNSSYSVMDVFFEFSKDEVWSVSVGFERNYTSEIPFVAQEEKTTISFQKPLDGVEIALLDNVSFREILIYS